MKLNSNMFDFVAKRKPTILVVDDSAMVRYFIEDTLSSAGFETRSAVDGEAAITTLQYDRVDAIVTDLEMPRVTGAELIRRVREHRDPQVYRLPILVVSSMTDEIAQARLKFLGANLFLPKPIDSKRLVATTNRLLPAA